MFPTLRLLAGEIPTLIEHAEAYADLAAEEVATLGKQTLASVLAWVLAGAVALVGLLLGGVALMLWGMSPSVGEGAHPWLLWAVPVGCMALAAICVVYAKSLPRGPVFKEVRSQWRADMALMREGSAS